MGNPALTPFLIAIRRAPKGYVGRLCETASFTRVSNQAEAARIAAAVPGIQSP